MQPVFEGEMENCPAGHAPHAAAEMDPLLAPVPAAHSLRQTVAPADSENFPLGHGWQPGSLATDPEEYVPAGQGEQEEAPEEEPEPAGQLVQPVFPGLTENDPATQVPHWLTPLPIEMAPAT